MASHAINLTTTQLLPWDSSFHLKNLKPLDIPSLGKNLDTVLVYRKKNGRVSQNRQVLHTGTCPCWIFRIDSEQQRQSIPLSLLSVKYAENWTSLLTQCKEMKALVPHFLLALLPFLLAKLEPQRWKF